MLVHLVRLLLYATRMMRTEVERAEGGCLQRAMSGPVQAALVGTVLAIALQSGPAVNLLLFAMAGSGLVAGAAALAGALGADLGSALAAFDARSVAGLAAGGDGDFLSTERWGRRGAFWSRPSARGVVPAELGLDMMLGATLGIAPIPFLESGAGVFIAMVYANILFMVSAGSHAAPCIMTRGTAASWFTQLSTTAVSKRPTGTSARIMRGVSWPSARRSSC